MFNINAIYFNIYVQIIYHIYFQTYKLISLFKNKCFWLGVSSYVFKYKKTEELLVK